MSSLHRLSLPSPASHIREQPGDIGEQHGDIGEQHGDTEQWKAQKRVARLHSLAHL